MLEATAPGKLVVAGEYAVLDGAPAIVAAMSRRARVRLTPSQSEFHEVRAPAYTETVGRFVLDGGVPSWVDGAEPFGLFNAVLIDGMPTLTKPLAIQLDTAEFFEGNNKLGLGSSAALAAALAVALGDYTESPPAPIAANAHRRFQHGRGSGADVAASLAGGLIDFRMQESGWTCLDWPEGLHYEVYFAGHSTSTGQQLRKFSSLGMSPERRALSAVAEDVANVFREPSVARLLGVCKRYTMALQAFDNAGQLGIFAGGHSELVAAADQIGLVYKPCGAGGGDIGIALSHDPTVLETFRRAVKETGFTPLTTEIDPRGARVTECLQ